MTFNKELQFKAYLVDKVGKAIKVVLVLYKLKGLQFKSVKQLTKSSVLLIANYILPI